MRQYQYTLIVGIPIAIIIAAVVAYNEHIPLSRFPYLLLIALPVVILGIAIDIFKHRLYLSSKGAGNSEDKYLLNQLRTITLNVPIHKADDLCVASLKELPRCRIKRETRFSSRIVATTGWSIFYVGLYERNLFHTTFGEIITFDIIKLDDNQTSVTLRSRPRFPIPLILVDYGKNLRNIEKIYSYLEKNNPRDQSLPDFQIR